MRQTRRCMEIPELENAKVSEKLEMEVANDNVAFSIRDYKSFLIIWVELEERYQTFEQQLD